MAILNWPFILRKIIYLATAVKYGRKSFTRLTPADLLKRAFYFKNLQIDELEPDTNLTLQHLFQIFFLNSFLNSGEFIFINLF